MSTVAVYMSELDSVINRIQYEHTNKYPQNKKTEKKNSASSWSLQWMETRQPYSNKRSTKK